MKSRATPRFWAAYRDLPPEIQDAARKAYRLFRDNAGHPSLQFKKVHDREPVYEDDEISWFWIGGHAEYDRLLERL